MYVCNCVCVCVWAGNSYLRNSVVLGAVFHYSGTFVLRSTDGYLALCGIKCDTNCTLNLQHFVLPILSCQLLRLSRH